MATYEELAGLRDDEAQWGPFLQKVRVATAIKATSVIQSATPGATILEWAKNAIQNPVPAGNAIVWYVVGANSSATVAQIYGASDDQIQTNVDAAVDAIYGS